MKALVLNSGIGSRMGDLTKDTPKCMVKIKDNETILSRQLKMLKKNNVEDIVMTTGYLEDKIIDYIKELSIYKNINYVYNNRYNEVNYIYSIYLAREYLNDDILLMHGDLVFDEKVLYMILNSDRSVMAVSSTRDIPKKDFKAVIKNNKINKIGVEYFENAVAAEAMYYIKKEDFKIWIDKIIEFVNLNKVNVYAENAFNELNGAIDLYPLDVKDLLCSEIDNIEDLNKVKNIL